MLITLVGMEWNKTIDTITWNEIRWNCFFVCLLRVLVALCTDFMFIFYSVTFMKDKTWIMLFYWTNWSDFFQKQFSFHSFKVSVQKWEVKTSDLLAYVLKFIGMFRNCHHRVKKKCKKCIFMFVLEIRFFFVSFRTRFCVSKWLASENCASAENGL